MHGDAAISFGDLLRRCRLAARLTQEALADRSGLSATGIQKLERGVSRPRRDTLRRLAAALDLSPDERAAFEAAGWSRPRRHVNRATPEPDEARRHNLPAPLTSFVGRADEIAEAAAQLATARLVTLVGVGGVGKTRLALETAARALDRYPDGVWLVELAALGDPALVPSSVAAAVGVHEAPGRPITDVLVAALRRQRALVVLDNCEHLLDACARLADEVLRQCPDLRVLATSREPLGITGEVSRRVPSLALPTMGRLPDIETLSHVEAVRLFVDRAPALQPGFAVTKRNALAVAQLCCQLDGIPLALELAAARIRALTVEQVAERLDRRFQLLTMGSRTALPRQRTLQATIDWSLELLTERERLLFDRFSVFVGGWTLEAAEGVCSGDGIEPADVLELLTHLVEKSLVVAEEHADGAERYRLLETLRQFGRERLVASGEAEALRVRHAAYYLTLAEEAEPHLVRREQLEWLDRLEIEHDNLRAALTWDLEEADEPEAALRLAGALAWFWYVGGYFSEGRSWLERALAAGAAAPASVRAKALKGAGDFAGDQDQAEARYEQGLALCRDTHDQRGIATALADLGRVAMERPDYAVARARFEESLVVGRELGDRWRVANALCWLGNVRREQGDYAAARSTVEEGLAVFRALGDRGGIARALTLLGQLAAHEGDNDAARTRLQEAVELFREARDMPGMGWSLGLLGSVDTRMGDHRSAVLHLEESAAVLRELGGSGTWYLARSLLYLGMAARGRGERALAWSLYRESLAVSRVWGYRRHVVEALEGCAGLAAADGQPGRTARLFGAAEALRADFGAPVPPTDRADHECDGAAARAALGEWAFAAAWAAGRALTLEQAIAEVLDEGEGREADVDG